VTELLDLRYQPIALSRRQNVGLAPQVHQLDGAVAQQPFRGGIRVEQLALEIHGHNGRPRRVEQLAQTLADGLLRRRLIRGVHDQPVHDVGEYHRAHRGRQDKKGLPSESRNHAGQRGACCERQDEERQDQPKLRDAGPAPICWSVAANLSALLLALRQLAHRLFLFPFSQALALNRLSVDCKRIPARVFTSPCMAMSQSAVLNPFRTILLSKARPWVCDFANCT
jgi:hypothetical protein